MTVTSIELNKNTTWIAHHEWTENRSVRIDGCLIADDGNRLAELDICTLSDVCCCQNEAIDALLAWNNGEVFKSTNHDNHGVDTLVIPFQTITSELLAEAMQRYARTL